MSLRDAITRFSMWRKVTAFPEGAISELNKAVWSSNAVINIELLSGAPFWGDERFDEFVMACKGRSSERIHDLNVWRLYLITGERSQLADYTRCEESWNYVLLRCPNWPGFRPERRMPEIASRIKTMIDDVYAHL